MSLVYACHKPLLTSQLTSQHTELKVLVIPLNTGVDGSIRWFSQTAGRALGGTPWKEGNKADGVPLAWSFKVTAFSEHLLSPRLSPEGTGLLSLALSLLPALKDYSPDARQTRRSLFWGAREPRCI